jgi:hypothetical protein
MNQTRGKNHETFCGEKRNPSNQKDNVLDFASEAVFLKIRLLIIKYNGVKKVPLNFCYTANVYDKKPSFLTEFFCSKNVFVPFFFYPFFTQFRSQTYSTFGVTSLGIEKTDFACIMLELEL